MEQFMVIGLGNFGFNVASALSEAGKQVIAVDVNSKKAEEISDKVRKAVTADIRDRKALAELVSANKIDAAIISLGNRLEASILATVYLKELKVARIIAKASNEDHGTILQAVGANEVIFPEREIANKLARRLVKPNLIDYIPMAEEYGIVELCVPDDFIGKTLMELQLRNKYRVEVIAIKNVLSDKFTIVPGGNYKIEPDTVMVIVGKNEYIEKIKDR
ncbi:MAG: potassium transporter TrkA [Candidatus Omnitrophica bacterium CG11_big_fil_rev_8_21_14_0_20_42_13]|uniref:Potassium transporter TrkA n=1 Tax=Candidatus Ghiorseimicrobium undicola TaxID=1974746 RepID=A0A2H0LZR8_9BACT|nr:MAG: potassium transporter TrkA [Candidatus Omnitrophica bacterium CG11_big_fil_rev_8_21_14_0_20_42_13]